MSSPVDVPVDVPVAGIEPASSSVATAVIHPVAPVVLAPFEAVITLLRDRRAALDARQGALELRGLVLCLALLVPTSALYIHLVNEGPYSLDTASPAVLQGAGVVVLLGAVLLASLVAMPPGAGLRWTKRRAWEDRLIGPSFQGRSGLEFSTMNAGDRSPEGETRTLEFVRAVFAPGLHWGPIPAALRDVTFAEFQRLWSGWFLVERQTAALRRCFRLGALGLLLGGLGLMVENSGGSNLGPSGLPPAGGLPSNLAPGGGTQGGGMQGGGMQGGGVQGGGKQGGQQGGQGGR
jgi:hypothetical protein